MAKFIFTTKDGVVTYLCKDHTAWMPKKQLAEFSGQHECETYYKKEGDTWQSMLPAPA